MLGKVSYQRRYYYDPATQTGESPLDRKLKVSCDRLSAGVRQQLVKLCARLPFKAACETLAELSGIKVSPSKAWKETQEAGRRARPALNPRPTGKAAVLPEDTVVIAMDGWMANIRQQGWKEVKLGVVSRKVGDKQSDASYVAHLGGPEGFGLKLLAEAQARRWQQARQAAVIGDGASWIWNLAQLDYPTAAHIVDWYHASQHVHAVAAQVFANPQEAQSWVEAQTDLLSAGDARRVAHHIKQLAARSPNIADTLKQEARYFESNHERMQYSDFQQAGLPIGSGMVEAGAKQFKQRICASGMRWSAEGLQNLLPLRAALLSDTFETFWCSLYPP